MRHTISRLAGVLLMLALLVAGGLAVLAHAHGTGGMAGSAAPARPTPCPNPPVSGGYGVSYAYAPLNLHEMKAMSDLVAEVSVVSFVREEISDAGVYSIFSARVLTPIAGKHAAGIVAGTTIQIRQLGGRVGCITYTLEGDPTLRPGERDILFLISHADDPVYDIIDDTVGRFVVESNGHIAPNAYTTVRVATGMSDTTFIQQIRQA